MGRYAIPLRSIRRVMEKAGAKRISDEALVEMEMQIEEYVMNITKAALSLLASTGKSTLKPEHLRVVRYIMGK